MKTAIAKKSVHINLLAETHAQFRILAFQNQLSMQEIIEELISSLVNSQNPALVKIIDNLSSNKKRKELQKMLPTDADSIFETLETSESIKDL